MLTLFDNFELNISQSAKGCIVTDSQGYKISQVSDTQKEELYALNKLYSTQFVQRGQLQEELGKSLFQIFVDSEQYQMSRRVSSEQGKGLRILVRLTDCIELSGLPWELFHDEHRFLADDPMTLIIRYNLPDKKLMLPDVTVRILLTICTSDSRPASVHQEEIRFLNELEQISYGAIKLTVLRRTTKNLFFQTFTSAANRDEPFHIWHHVGTGIVDNNNNFVFQFDDGTLSLDQLSQILQSSNELRAVTLNLQYDKSEGSDNFTKLSAEPRGISSSLNYDLRRSLLQCGPFATEREIRSIFVDSRIQPWRSSLPEADNQHQRVEAIIDHLHSKFDNAGKNALVLLLQVLAERIDPTDACFRQLSTLATQIEKEVTWIDPPVNPTRFKVLNLPILLGFSHNVDSENAHILFQTFYYFLFTHGVSHAIQQACQHVCHNILNPFDWGKVFALLQTKEEQLIELPPPSGNPDIHIRNQVFISYSHKDKEWLSGLRTILKPLQDYREVQIWSDTDILPGTKWQNELEVALQSAKVAIMLVSPAFLASDFIKVKEMPKILEASEKEGLTIIWVPISASMYQITPIADYKAAQDPSIPLDSLTEAEQNQVWVRIAQMVQNVLDS